VIAANPENNPFGTQEIVLIFMGVGTVLAFLCPKPMFRRIDGLVQGVCRRPWHAAGVLAVLAVGIAILPALTFPFGGDEKHLYEAGSIFANQGGYEFLRRYPQTWAGYRHPMLVPLMAGVGQTFFGHSVFWVRLLFVGFLAGSTAITYAIGRRLYGETTGFQAAILYLSLRLVLFMGIRVSTDLPVTFFVLLAIFLSLRLSDHFTIGHTIQTGWAVALGFFSKYTMGLVLPALGYISIRGRKRFTWLHVVTTAGFLALFLGGGAAVLHVMGALDDQVQFIGSLAGWSNGGLDLFSSWRMRFRLEALFVQIPSALGAYALPILALGGWNAARRWERSEQILAVWIGSISLPLLAILPVERYFLPAFPAFALVGALGLRSMGNGSYRVLLLALLYSVGTALLYT
jgi:4-amino-4-deoxy-L-arabinose transferase-like glycosyltransferase